MERLILGIISQSGQSLKQQLTKIIYCERNDKNFILHHYKIE